MEILDNEKKKPITFCSSKCEKGIRNYLLVKITYLKVAALQRPGQSYWGTL